VGVGGGGGGGGSSPASGKFCKEWRKKKKYILRSRLGGGRFFQIGPQAENRGLSGFWGAGFFFFHVATKPISKKTGPFWRGGFPASRGSKQLEPNFPPPRGGGGGGGGGPKKNKKGQGKIRGGHFGELFFRSSWAGKKGPLLSPFFF